MERAKRAVLEAMFEGVVTTPPVLGGRRDPKKAAAKLEPVVKMLHDFGDNAAEVVARGVVGQMRAAIRAAR